MNRNDVALQTIQSLLKKDEHLLWWDYPKLRYMRKPLQITDVLLLVLLGLIFAFLFVLVINFVTKTNIYFVDDIKIFLIFWIFSASIMCLRSWLRTFTTALKKAPPYWQYTLYTLTNLRVLIIVALPGTQPATLAYLPQEIQQSTVTVRLDDSGTVVFSVPRQVKVSRYGKDKDIILPGSFVGISNVEHVVELLQQLKAQSE